MFSDAIFRVAFVLFFILGLSSLVDSISMASSISSGVRTGVALEVPCAGILRIWEGAEILLPISSGLSLGSELTRGSYPSTWVGGCRLLLASGFLVVVLFLFVVWSDMVSVITSGVRASIVYVGLCGLVTRVL
jgi:hypothetical protein